MICCLFKCSINDVVAGEGLSISATGFEPGNNVSNKRQLPGIFSSPGDEPCETTFAGSLTFAQSKRPIA